MSCTTKNHQWMIWTQNAGVESVVYNIHVSVVSHLQTLPLMLYTYTTLTWSCQPSLNKQCHWVKKLKVNVGDTSWILTIMNSPHDSECIKSWHILVWFAASYRLPKYYAKTAQFEIKNKHVLSTLYVQAWKRLSIQ